VITDPSVLTAEFSTRVNALQPERLLVYPDPATSILQVNLPFDAVRLRMLASDGRQVLFLSDLHGTSTLNVERLPSGAYSVEVITATGTIHRARFIKQ
jgi:hypothetical protein